MKNNVNKILVLFFVTLAIGFSQDNYSLSFDGVNDFVYSSNINYDLTDGGSAHFFVKSDQISDGHKYILSQSSYPAGNYSVFEMSINEGYLNWHIRDNDGNNVGNVFDQIFLADNQWHEVFLVFDGLNNQVEVTVDGVSIVSDVSNLGSINTLTPFYLGSQNHHGHHFNGLISNATVWDEVIDINSIDDFNDHRILDYNINEGEGETLIDLSEDGNDGTIYGATWSDDVPSLENDSDYAVGSLGPAGGFIIYDKGLVSDGWRYIEIAPDGWYGDGDPTTTWGCSGSEINGADGYAVGSGLQNSIDIANGCDGDNAASISLNTEIK